MLKNGISRPWSTEKLFVNSCSRALHLSLAAKPHYRVSVCDSSAIQSCLKASLTPIPLPSMHSMCTPRCFSPDTYRRQPELPRCPFFAGICCTPWCSPFAGGKGCPPTKPRHHLSVVLCTSGAQLMVLQNTRLTFKAERFKLALKSLEGYYRDLPFSLEYPLTDATCPALSW